MRSLSLSTDASHPDRASGEFGPRSGWFWTMTLWALIGSQQGLPALCDPGTGTRARAKATCAALRRTLTSRHHEGDRAWVKRADDGTGRAEEAHTLHQPLRRVATTPAGRWPWATMEGLSCRDTRANRPGPTEPRGGSLASQCLPPYARARPGLQGTWPLLCGEVRADDQRSGRRGGGLRWATQNEPPVTGRRRPGVRLFGIDAFSQDHRS